MRVKSKDILKIIKNFKKLSKPSLFNKIFGKDTIKEKRLDMGEGKVNQNHPCGTVHCHGGWYAVAACSLRQKLTYLDGATKMAKDLGFSSVFSKEDLETWASTNTEIWGNRNGSNMFGGKMAFHHQTKRPQGALNLQHIVDHWTEVYERVKAIEDKAIEDKKAEELAAKKHRLLTEPPVNALINDTLKNQPNDKRTIQRPVSV